MPEEHLVWKLYIDVAHTITLALLVCDFYLMQHGKKWFFTHQHHHG